MVYLLMSDGFFLGQSLGKRIVGIKTVFLDPETKLFVPVTFAQSAIRNCAFAAILFLMTAVCGVQDGRIISDLKNQLRHRVFLLPFSLLTILLMRICLEIITKKY